MLNLLSTHKQTSESLGEDDLTEDLARLRYVLVEVKLFLFMAGGQSSAQPHAQTARGLSMRLT